MTYATLPTKDQKGQHIVLDIENASEAELLVAKETYEKDLFPSETRDKLHEQKAYWRSCYAEKISPFNYFLGVIGAGVAGSQVYNYFTEQKSEVFGSDVAATLATVVGFGFTALGIINYPYFNKREQAANTKILSLQEQYNQEKDPVLAAINSRLNPPSAPQVV